MTYLEQFLAANNLKQTDLIEYLGLSKGQVSQLVKGKSNMTDIKLFKLKRNPYGWDCSMLPDDPIIQSIGDNSNNNTQTINEGNREAELWRKLCEEKDKRIATLEQLVALLSGQNSK